MSDHSLILLVRRSEFPHVIVSPAAAQERGQTAGTSEFASICRYHRYVLNHGVTPPYRVGLVRPGRTRCRLEGPAFDVGFSGPAGATPYPGCSRGNPRSAQPSDRRRHVCRHRRALSRPRGADPAHACSAAVLPVGAPRQSAAARASRPGSVGAASRHDGSIGYSWDRRPDWHAAGRTGRRPAALRAHRSGEDRHGAAARAVARGDIHPRPCRAAGFRRSQRHQTRHDCPR